jgi:hypothetical protein
MKRMIGIVYNLLECSLKITQQMAVFSRYVDPLSGLKSIRTLHCYIQDPFCFQPGVGTFTKARRRTNRGRGNCRTRSNILGCIEGTGSYQMAYKSI